MKTIWLVAMALPLMAAAPPRQLTLAVPGDGGLSLPSSQPSLSLGERGRKPVYEPAPLPNRDVSVPQPARQSEEPRLAPTLFTSKPQYRGDGFSPGSSPQNEQERRVRPGAGFSLHMPLTPQ